SYTQHYPERAPEPTTHCRHLMVYNRYTYVQRYSQLRSGRENANESDNVIEGHHRFYQADGLRVARGGNRLRIQSCIGRCVSIYGRTLLTTAAGNIGEPGLRCWSRHVCRI